jgi:hypothetical protein
VRYQEKPKIQPLIPEYQRSIAPNDFIQSKHLLVTQNGALVPASDIYAMNKSISSPLPSLPKAHFQIKFLEAGPGASEGPIEPGSTPATSIHH